MSGGPAALALEGLSVAYQVRGRDVPVLREVSFSIEPGQAYGLVGESGSGKSTAALAAVRHLPANGHVQGGRVRIGDRDLFALGKDELRRLRATELAMVSQDPAKALNPSMRVGEQVAEVFRLQGHAPAEAMARAVDMLARVRIADPASVARRYPHMLSGGMQQRVAIAMALAAQPRVLILDEPTTGLDATVEAEILDLIDQARRELNAALLFISHNLALIAGACDRIGVLYAGELIETGPTRAVLDNPRHPYTLGLTRCLPRSGRRKTQGELETIPGLPPEPGVRNSACTFAPRCSLATALCWNEPPPSTQLGERFSRCFFADQVQSAPQARPLTPPPAVSADGRRPILQATGLSKTFKTSRRPVHALRDVSITLHAGETLALVGESGSGKTTLARLLLGLETPDHGGRMALDGEVLHPKRRPDQIKAVQIVFQNADSALNPALTVGRQIGRVLFRLAKVPRSARSTRLNEMIRSVRLPDAVVTLRPRQLSGGMKQRVAIARAIAGEPRIVVCDEPLSALDVSVQAAILNLLVELQSRLDIAYLFISHDLASVQYLSDRVAVLYLGRLMEVGPTERVLAGPHHPYTASLVSAVPALDGRPVDRVRLGGEIPSAIDPPTGCVFHTRCPRKLGPICEDEEPPLYFGGEPGHQIRCHIFLP